MFDISFICTPGKKKLINNKYANTTVRNIPCKLFYKELVPSQSKYNIECWLFILLRAYLYESIDIL